MSGFKPVRSGQDEPIGSKHFLAYFKIEKKKINGLAQAYNFSSYKINKPSRADSFNFKPELKLARLAR
ncbi:hypothetical protein Hanom_Chr12g01165491 [Helianthus anomalus]